MKLGPNDTAEIATFTGTLTAVVLMDLPDARVLWELEPEPEIAIKVGVRVEQFVFDEVVDLLTVLRGSPSAIGVHKGRWIVRGIQRLQAQERAERLSREPVQPPEENQPP